MPQYPGKRPATDTRLLLAIEILRSPAPFMPRDIAEVLSHWLEQVAKRSGEHVPVAATDYNAALEIADLAISRRHS